MPTVRNPDDLAHHLLAWPGEGRVLVAIAGAPGCGKSTLAKALVGRIEGARPGYAALLGMDGYHYDDRVLKGLGRYARKGAADTFDTDGLRHMLMRLKRNNEGKITVPVFDRSLEIARAGAMLIEPAIRIVVVEGNYLLLDEPLWRGVAGMFDLTVMISAREDTLHKRLTRRWQGYGLAESDIRRKVRDNDLPNGRHVVAGSVAADIVLATEEMRL